MLRTRAKPTRLPYSRWDHVRKSGEKLPYSPENRRSRLLSDGGSYLGVSNDGRVLLYKSCATKETKFFPVVIDSNTVYQNTQTNVKKSIGIFD